MKAVAVVESVTEICENKKGPDSISMPGTKFVPLKVTFAVDS